MKADLSKNGFYFIPKIIVHYLNNYPTCKKFSNFTDFQPLAMA
jgi:hypothetical protein